MGVIQIELPENVLISTGQSREELIREAKEGDELDREFDDA